MKLNNRCHRTFNGLVFIIAAVILLIGKLGVFGNINIWSLVFTIFLGIVIIKSIYPINFSGILFPIAFLCIIYSKELHIESLTPWTVLAAALLGTIGLSIIFHDSVHHHCHWHSHHEKDYEFTVINEEDESNIIQKISFGGVTKYINSNDFKQADLNATCGAMEIYFDRAHIKNGSAVVRINGTCSGIELFIPKEWAIENKLNVTLSGVEEKNRNIPDGSATLILIGDITLCGITLIYV